MEEVNRPRWSWEGMDEQPRLKNLRGIALLLSVAEFLRGTLTSSTLCP